MKSLSEIPITVTTTTTLSLNDRTAGNKGSP